jgi:DNA-binding Lrp family transcriptional regulator
MNARRLDVLDRQIIERLARDARVSNRAIATELGVTEGTIRGRIKRLQADGLIQFTVVTDYQMAGAPNLVMLGVDADPSRVAELARTLSDLPEISCVIVLLGRYSLLVMGLFSTVERLNDLISTRIRPLDGVRDIEVSISVASAKYEVGLARITAKRQ